MFQRDVTSEFSATNFVGAEEGEEYGSGYLVTGDLSWVPEGAHTFSPTTRRPVVEPTLLITELNAFVRNIRLCNTLETCSVECGNTRETPDGLSAVEIADTCIGDVKFRPGHNMSIVLSESTNTLLLTPKVGSGMGRVCDMPPRYPGVCPEEVIPPNCSELMYTINGVPPTNRFQFQIIGGAGVQVIPMPSEHAIGIVFDVDGMLACIPDEDDGRPPWLPWYHNW
jgi:hypothetical protein